MVLDRTAFFITDDHENLLQSLSCRYVGIEVAQKFFLQFKNSPESKSVANSIGKFENEIEKNAFPPNCKKKNPN